MLKFFKKFLYNKKLKKAFALREPLRKKTMVPFSEMKSCLVIFDASDEQNCHIMFSIIKEMQDLGKVVRAVGYVPWKNNPHWCFPKISYDYINASGVAFSGAPKADFVNDLLDSRFDLLIDFLQKPVPPVCYISSLVYAGLKVARKRSEDEHFMRIFDVIIDNNELSDRAFFEELKRYLYLLKSGQE